MQHVGAPIGKSVEMGSPLKPPEERQRSQVVWIPDLQNDQMTKLCCCKPSRQRVVGCYSSNRDRKQRKRENRKKKGMERSLVGTREMSTQISPPLGVHMLAFRMSLSRS